MNSVQRQDFANGRQMALAVLLQVAADSIAARSRFVLALAGGTTPIHYINCWPDRDLDHVTESLNVYN